MEAFARWFAELGPALADPGNPVGRTCTVDPDGNVSEGGGANPVRGYSIIEAASIEESDRHGEARTHRARRPVRRGRRPFMAARWRTTGPRGGGPSRPALGRGPRRGRDGQRSSARACADWRSAA